MQVRRLTIENFRGVSSGTVDFASAHTLLVGGNNVGKSTVCEALDLVLGPERMSRRPVVNEHDFFCGRYLTDDSTPVETRISAILTDLHDEARNRFYRHLRPWDEEAGAFADVGSDGPASADGATFALPVSFVGRYNKEEDDFEGNTFFDHPIEELEPDEAEELALGGGRSFFGREQKRLCGFIYLRAHRTGARALSLQRGSLLDTILRLGGSGLAEMWQQTLTRLREFEPGIGDIEQLKHVRSELRSRMSHFVKLGEQADPTSFFASNLTREHLREVVSLFIATQPDGHLLPFQRLGTGSLNLLVFALLTFIAELKDKRSAIFAMEEPEIALPPHTQRRVMQFALREMGQVIVTSHSPYVIDEFEPDRIVVLDRDSSGQLTGKPALPPGLAPKRYRAQRRQFAEALLAQAVLVVEGGTEASIFPAASAVLERALGPDAYTHIDLAGLSVFDAGGHGSVPDYGPVFQGLRKTAFAFIDGPSDSLIDEDQTKLAVYKKHWISPTKGIEQLLIDEVPVATQRLFIADVRARPDFPPVGTLAEDAGEAAVREYVYKILKARKGQADAYAGVLVSHCESKDDLPQTIRNILLEIHKDLASATTMPTLADDPPLGSAGEAGD